MLNISRAEIEQRIAVLDEVSEERTFQDSKWGGPEHDDQHRLGNWLHFIEDRAAYQRFVLEHPDRASDSPYLSDYRATLVKIAALAVAAIESFDRMANASADFVEANPDALESIRQKFAQKLAAQKPGHPWLTGEGAFAKYAPVPETSAVGADNKCLECGAAIMGCPDGRFQCANGHWHD